MGKGILKALRKSKPTKYTGKRHLGPCFVEECQNNGATIHECLTCVNLHKEKPFQIQCCGEHWEAGLKKVKAHALIKHPTNILRVTLAGLKGEKI
jgi:hypothetical protein